ncbi:MAG: phosphotransferase [Candidatus Melainabacteria bacterium]|nr:phosphotransferase [Candidatus Melainabacteria bacterium]
MKEHSKTTKTKNRGDRKRLNRSRLLSSDRKFAQVVSSLDPAARLIEVRKLSGGISAEMTAIKFSDDKTVSSVVVRRHSEKSFEENPNIAHFEFEVLKFMREAGLPVPHPYHLDNTGIIFKRPYVVLGLLDGDTIYAPEDKLTYGRKMAEMLLVIHATAGDRDLLPEQKKRLDKDLAKIKDKWDDAIEEQKIRARLKSIWPVIKPNESKVLHGDFWPGNILWQNGEITGVLDWEECELGDPMLEIAITRFDLLCICGVECMEAFTDRYVELSGIDKTNLPVYDLFASLRPAGKLAEWARGWRELGRQDITEQDLHQSHQIFREKALAAT